MRIGNIILMGGCAMILFCSSPEQSSMKIEKSSFGQHNGTPIDMYTLSNSNNMQVGIINYGAIVQKLVVPDRDGKFEDVVLGYDRLEDYIKASPYFGAIVGRYGNRIAKGKFELDGQTYTLAVNNGENHLHGGDIGFDKVVWAARPIESDNEVGLELSYLSKDGEEGYPGNLNVKVTYTLTNANELKIDYLAVTDKPTPCNLTHHGYFNLSGNSKRNILGHKLYINADSFTPVDEGLIPVGERRAVKDTPFDFNQATEIGQRIKEDNQQLQFGLGYDHNWCLNDVDGTLKLQASLTDPESGRHMEVFTIEPGLQFYSGNFLDGSNVGKNEKVYNFRDGLCLETQHFPDSPNQPQFPTTILKPGEEYKTKTVYKFSVK